MKELDVLKSKIDLYNNDLYIRIEKTSYKIKNEISVLKQNLNSYKVYEMNKIDKFNVMFWQLYKKDNKTMAESKKNFFSFL